MSIELWSNIIDMNFGKECPYYKILRYNNNDKYGSWYEWHVYISRTIQLMNDKLNL